MTVLNISKNTVLKALFFNYNQLTELDVSNHIFHWGNSRDYNYLTGETGFVQKTATENVVMVYTNYASFAEAIYPGNYYFEMGVNPGITSAYAVACVYDGDDLVRLGVVNGYKAGHAVASSAVYVSQDDIDNNRTLKFMVWNSMNGMTPIAQNFTFND